MTASTGQVIPDQEWYRVVNKDGVSARLMTETPESNRRYWLFFCEQGKRYQLQTMDGLTFARGEIFDGQDNAVTYGSVRTVNGFVSHFLFEVA